MPTGAPDPIRGAGSGARPYGSSSRRGARDRPRRREILGPEQTGAGGAQVVIRFTGAGCLAPLIAIGCVFLGAAVAGNLFPDAFPSPAAGVVIAAVLLVTAPVHWWIGRALNSTVTPQGRVWHDSHTYFGAPIQKGAGVNTPSPLTAVSTPAGGATSPIVGWAILVGTPIVAWLVWASRADGARL